jgi:hypothetical protein
MFYHLWTMRKHLEELQQGTTVSISIGEYTIWKIIQHDKYNCETSNSTPLHTTTNQTATIYTISVGVSLDELYKTHAGLRKLIQFLTI